MSDFQVNLADADGRVCAQKVTITINTPSQTMAWWTMDLGTPVNEADSVSGLLLARLVGVPASFSTVPGKVNNAVQTAGALAEEDDLWTGHQVALEFNGVGVTLCFWVNITDTVPAALNVVSLTYTFDQNGISYPLRVSRTGQNGDDWILSLSGAGNIHKASAAGWHFLAITFDDALGQIGFDIDQSGMAVAGVAVPPAGAHTFGQIILNATGHAVVPQGQLQVMWDEVAIFNAVLTAAQLDSIYNAGAGHTWPWPP